MAFYQDRTWESWRAEVRRAVWSYHRQEGRRADRSGVQPARRPNRPAFVAWRSQPEPGSDTR